MDRRAANAAGHRVLVIGAGVTGLTTALCLRREGFDITVVAEKFAPDIVSVVAGALWEWPPAVCGAHQDEISLARSKQWCMTSYEAFARLSKRPETGVFLRPVVFYFREPIAQRPRDLAKMHELKDRVRGFVHDARLIEDGGANPAAGMRDAYQHVAPMIDTDRYMAWLMGQVRRAGCEVVQGRVNGALRRNEPYLEALFGVQCIVNCSGLGALELADDDMYPLRGALIRVRNDGVGMPPVLKAHCVSHEQGSTEQDMVFIVPRGTNTLLLGGLTEPHQWSLDLDLKTYGPVQEMLRRCRDFLPALAGAELDRDDPLRVGLRPFRQHNVRVEREPGTDVIHNYGHGGSGVTLSWGCAEEVVSLVKETVGVGEQEPLRRLVSA